MDIFAQVVNCSFLFSWLIMLLQYTPYGSIMDGQIHNDALIGRRGNQNRGIKQILRYFIKISWHTSFLTMGISFLRSLNKGSQVDANWAMIPPM